MLSNNSLITNGSNTSPNLVGVDLPNNVEKLLEPLTNIHLYTNKQIRLFLHQIADKFDLALPKMLVVACVVKLRKRGVDAAFKACSNAPEIAFALHKLTGAFHISLLGNPYVDTSIQQIIECLCESVSPDNYQNFYEAILETNSFELDGESLKNLFLNGSQKKSATAKALTQTTGRFYPYQFDPNRTEDDLQGVPGQIRVDNPKGIKIGIKWVRYLTIKKTSPAYFLLEPPEYIKTHLMNIWGEDEKGWYHKTFWGYVIANPRIPIVITEGVKKAASFLAMGIPAIACPGFNMMLGKYGDFEPNQLCGKNRQWIFALDQEKDQKIANQINLQITKVTKAISNIHENFREPEHSITQLTWEEKIAKGFDDLVTAVGLVNLPKYLSYTDRLPEQENGLLVNLNLPKSQQFFGDIIPNPKEHPIVFLKGRKGNGKTFSTASHFNKTEHKDKPKIVLTHRRKLTRDAAAKFDNMAVLEDLESGANVTDLGLVINSFHPSSKLNKKIKDYAGGLIFLDECGQAMRELLTSKLMQKTRLEIITYLSDVLTTVVQTGGQIIFADADLNQEIVDFWSSLIMHPAPNFVIKNNWEHPSYKATYFIEYPNRNCRPSSLVLKRGADYLVAGKRVLIMTGSQKRKSRYGAQNIADVFIEREIVSSEDTCVVDSETTSNPEHEASKAINNKFTNLKQKQLVVMSPICETGVSLEDLCIGKFDVVLVFANGVQHPDIVRQMALRYRNLKCPRVFVIWGVSDQRNLPFYGNTDPRQILHQINKSLYFIKKEIDDTTDTPNIIEENKILRPLKNAETYLNQHSRYKNCNLLKHIANIYADQNLNTKHYRYKLLSGLTAEGVTFDFNFLDSDIPKIESNAGLFNYDVLDFKKLFAAEERFNQIANVELPVDEEALKQLKFKRENLTTKETIQKQKLFYLDYLGIDEVALTPELVKKLDNGLLENMRFFYLASHKQEIFNLTGRGACRSLINGNYHISDFDLIIKLNKHKDVNYLKYVLNKYDYASVDDLIGKTIIEETQRDLWRLCKLLGLIPNDAEDAETCTALPEIYKTIAKNWLAEDRERLEKWRNWESQEILRQQLTELAENGSKQFKNLWKVLKNKSNFEEAFATLPFYVRASLLNEAQKNNLSEPAIVQVDETNQKQLLSELSQNDYLGLDLETWGDEQLLPKLPYPNKAFKAKETGGLDHIVGAIRFMQIYVPTSHTTYIIDLGGRDNSVGTWTGKLLQNLKKVITAKTIVGHNIHFDLRFLRKHLGWQFSKIIDTRIMMQCLFHVYDGTKVFDKGFGLGNLAKQFLNLEINKELQVSDWGGFISTNQINYAAIDPWITFALYKRLTYIYNKPKMFGLSQLKPKHHHYKLECKEVLALVEMEYNGVPFNMKAAKEFIEAGEKQLNELTKKIKKATNGLSPTQDIALRKCLNKKYGLELKSLGKSIKKKYAKTAKELGDGTYEEFIWCQQFKTIKKLLEHAHKAYNSAFLNNGNVCTQFSVLTGTGRTASGNAKAAAMPNIQSVPKGSLNYDHRGHYVKTWIVLITALNASPTLAYKFNSNRTVKGISIRELYGFQESENNSMVIADLSASHNRIGAKLAKDEKAATILRNNLDGHSIKALSVLKCLEDNDYSVVGSDQGLVKAVSDETNWFDLASNKHHKELVSKQTLNGGKGHRDVAKTISYGALNGSGAGKAAEIVQSAYGLDLKRSDAKEILDAYWAATPDIQQYIKNQVKCVEENTFIINDLKFGIYYLGWEGNYMCFPIINGRLKPTQITASLWSRPESTVLKCAQVQLQKMIDNGKLGDAKIVNIVHDELVVICSAEYAHKVSLAVNQVMQDEMNKLLDGFVPADTQTPQEIADSGSGVGLTWAAK